MSNVRKFIMVLVIFCSFSFIVFANGDEESSTANKQDEKVTIYGLVNVAHQRMLQQDLVPVFNEEFPNIEVVIDGAPYSELMTKQMLEVTAKKPSYDFYWQDDPWLPQIASTGGLVDLKNEFADITDPGYDWDDFFEGPLQAGVWEDTVYGVPIRANLLLMFINTELYKDAGLAVPGEGYSWDDLMDDLPKLCRDTNGDGKDDVWGVSTYFGRDTLTPTIWQSIMNSNGVEIIDENFKPTFNNQVGIDALQYHIDLASYGPPGAKAHTFNESIEAFKQGKVAVHINWGSIFKSVAIDPETTNLTPGTVAIAPLPGGSAYDASSHRGIWTASVLNKSKYKEEAWQFIQWVTSKEGEIWTSENISSFPSRLSTLTSEPAEEWLGDMYNVIIDSYKVIGDGAMWRPRLVDSDAIQQILALHHSKAMNGDVSAAQALADAEKEIIAYLKDKEYY